MKKALVLLSGCGSLDGSEIHEAVLCLLSLDQLGFSAQCAAPDVSQATTINHLTLEQEKAPRKALVESARIARGKILPLEQVPLSDFQLLVMPGGLGAATTLSSYSTLQEHALVITPVRKLVVDFFSAKKPVVATCIAPALVALSLKGLASIRLTLGTSKTQADCLERMGMIAVPCTAKSFVLDEKHKIATTPAYMENTSLAELWLGIAGAIGAAAAFV